MMEINSKDELNAFTEYQKMERVQKIEDKLHRLSFTPILAVAALMFYGFYLAWTDVNSVTPYHLILVAALLANVGYTNVKRTDLMRELFELKYGKQQI